MKRLKPQQVVALSFLSAILIGTVLLNTPLSSRDLKPIGFIDSLFTATSATCVTGLVVKDTSRDFSLFGQIVILLLIQAGGLGIMTFSTLFAIFLGKKLTLRENLVIKSALDRHSIKGLKGLIIYIVSLTFFIEAIGASILFLRFSSFWPSVFHSISAFCNAGFSLFSNSLQGFKGDLIINLTFTTLIILGGLGFVVLLEIPKLFTKGFNSLELHSKIVLTITFILIISGAFIFYILEYKNSLLGITLKEKILASCFQSVATRTAGFNTVPTGNLITPTLFFMAILMFIGASPGSTGGGIKTTTFGILFTGAISMLKNREDISIFKKRVPREIFRKAVMITGLAICWIVVFTIFLTIFEGPKKLGENFFLKVLFEVVSAFGTVGLSTGITPLLGSISKLLIIFTMFFGRVGPLTLAMAIALQEERVLFRYPEEKVMVG